MVLHNFVFCWVHVQVNYDQILYRMRIHDQSLLNVKHCQIVFSLRKKDIQLKL